MRARTAVIKAVDNVTVDGLVVLSRDESSNFTVYASFILGTMVYASYNSTALYDQRIANQTYPVQPIGDSNRRRVCAPFSTLCKS